MTNGEILLIINSVKKLFISTSALLAYLSLPVAVLADSNTGTSVDLCYGATGISAALCKLGGGNVGNTLRNVIALFVVLAVVVALLYLLYGGIKWITSKGEKTEVEAARNHITAALVGLVVVFLAIFILSLVLAAFGINFSDLVIPTITSGAR